MSTTTLEAYAEINPATPAIDRTSREPVLFVPMAGVSEAGRLSAVQTRPLTEVAKGYTYFEDNDVLMAKITPCMENGKAVLLDGVFPRRGFGSTEFHVLRPRSGVHPKFVFFLIWNPRFRAECAKKMTGTGGQKRVPAAMLREARVPLYPLAEQRRIADILDKADAIRRKRAEAVAHVDDLLRATFLDRFGDPVTNPKGWRARRLAEVATITTGNTPSRAVSEYFGDAIEWIKSDNINTPSHFLTRATEGLSEAGREVGRSVEAGSTLITCIAGSPDCIGNAALADRTVAFNQQINAVTPGSGLDPRFLYALLLVGKQLVQRASTNSMKGMVSKGKLEQVPIPIPEAALQRDFGRAFDKLMDLSRQFMSAAGEADHLFDALVQRAFTGELTSAKPSGRAVQTSLFADGV